MDERAREPRYLYFSEKFTNSCAPQRADALSCKRETVYNIHVRAFDAYEILIFAYVNLTSKNDDNNWQALFTGRSKNRERKKREEKRE